MDLADTYFFSPEEALKIAKQHNTEEQGYWLQTCYYQGEKLEEELPNLIYLPLDNLIEDLANGIYRFPTQLSFAGLDISASLKASIVNDFTLALEEASRLRILKNIEHVDKLKNSKLDFNEPLRIYLSANKNTQVMQYVSKDIADELRSLGYNVLYKLDIGCEDISSSKIISEFNPHITININHMNNVVLSDDVFNFVWFQDAMPILTSNESINLRDRDYIFVYSNLFANLLRNKNIPENKIFEQTFIPVNRNNFFIDETVPREDKVGFVGSFYPYTRYAKYMTPNIDKKLKDTVNSGVALTNDTIKFMFRSENVDISNDDVYVNEVQQSYNRNITVAWLSKIKCKDVDIYGYGWDESNEPDIKSKFKGKIEKSELNRFYNQVKYVLCSSGRLINTQRLGEIVHSGAIPLVYDSRKITDEKETWDDECLYFKTEGELNYILENNILPQEYRSERMLNYFTYDKFITTILNIVNNKVEKE